MLVVTYDDVPCGRLSLRSRVLITTSDASCAWIIARLNALRCSASTIVAIKRFVCLLRLNVLPGFIIFYLFKNTGGALGSRTLSTTFMIVRISNPLPYHPAHAPIEFVYRHTMSKSCAGSDSKYRPATGFRYSNKCLGRLATHIWITVHT